MREFLVAVAVCVALIGCDNKPSSTSSTSTTSSTATEGAKAEGTKTAEPAKAVAKHPWGSFKKGSFAKLKSVTDMEVAGNKMKTEMTMTYTLKDLTANEAVVETEMVMANVPPQKNEMKMPLKAPEGKAADGPKPKTGSEEIEVAGKKYKCTWTEIETEAAGTKSVSKTWMCDDVPGHMVKSVTKSSGSSNSTTTMELVEFSSK